MKAKMLNVGLIAILIVSTGLFSNSFAGQVNEDYLILGDHDHKGISIHFSDYKVNYSGYFEISDDDRRILSVSPNGYLKVEKLVFGSSRKIEITSDSKGNLSKTYYEGRATKPFEKEGKQWLSDILPKIVRSTGVGAEHRVERIFKKEGIEGLLDEIYEINDHNPAARNLYFVIMVDQLKLSDKDLQRAVPKMSMIVSNSTKGTLMRKILTKYDVSSQTALAVLETTSTHSYNTERGSTLRVFNKQFKEEGTIIDEYIKILEDMSINSEKGNVIKDLFQTNKLKPETFGRIFEHLSSYSLMRERGAILLMALDYMPNDSEVQDEFNEAVEDIDRDYYILKGEIMDALLTTQMNGGKSSGPKAKKEFVINMLRSTDGISSNSQRGLLLRKINRIIPADREVYEEYGEAILNISDNIEKYNVLLDFIRRNDLDKYGYEMVLETTEYLVSKDYQHAAGAVLRECLKDMPYVEDLFDDFFDIIDEMDQNSTIEELLRLVNERDDLAKNEFVTLRVIEATKRIDVDIEKVSVLSGLKHYNPKSSSQEMAMEYAIDDIRSDYLMRKAKNQY